MSRLKEVTIDVATEFSDMPYGRSSVDNEFNGKEFRTEHLLKALKSYDTVIVDLTGVMGTGSSFLDEAFAGLIKYEGYKYEDIKDRLIFKSKYKSVLNNIEKYMREAKAG
ncbi:hypothetical protein D9M68_39820 [compost metagenome]